MAEADGQVARQNGRVARSTRTTAWSGSGKRLGQYPGRSKTALVVADKFHDFFRAVGDGHEIEVAGGDKSALQFQFPFHPFYQSFPMTPAEQDQRELGNALGLHERQHFKEFVQCAKTAGHEDKPEAVFYKGNFAGEEIMKLDGDIGKAIARLLMGQFDVQSDRFAAGLRRAFVGGFHDAGAAAGNDGEIMLGQALGNRGRRLIILVRRLGAGRSKDRHGGANLRHGLKRIDEFGHDPKNAPGVLADKCITIAHARRIDVDGKWYKQENDGDYFLN